MSAKELNPARGPHIRRLLRRRESQEYFKGGGWTSDPAQAETFEDVLQAAKTCAHYGLKDVELALRFEQGAEDVFCTQLR